MSKFRQRYLHCYNTLEHFTLYKSSNTRHYTIQHNTTCTCYAKCLQRQIQALEEKNQIQFLSANAQGGVKVMKVEIQAYIAKYLQKFCTEHQKN